MKNIVTVMFVILPVGAYAMAGRSAPVYGRPTLYGEYEISSGDTRRAAVLYGAVPAERGAAVKMPVKTKTPIPKKQAKKKKTVKKVRTAAQQNKAVPVQTKKVVSDANVGDIVTKKAITPPQEEVVSPKVDAPKQVPAPSSDAVAIAGAAVVPDADAFCTRRGRVGSGKLPDGIILMPGRPDLMSCSEK